MIRRATIEGIVEAHEQRGGVGEVSDAVADALAAEVEYRIRQLTQDALKMMQHCARDVLSAEDFAAALRLRNVEPLYGYRCTDSVEFRQVEGYDDLFYIEDCEESLEDVLSAPIPKGPVDPTFTMHWLAVEGIQPAIPQNPGFQGAVSDKAQDSVEAGKASKSNVTVKAAVKHVLSKEQQMYFQHVCDGIRSGDGKLQLAIHRSLATEAGLHQLLPYFTQFIADEVHRNLKNLSLLMQLMKMARALIFSPHLYIEPYLHQLMPPILTCMVGRTLCMNASEDHWALRDFAASLVSLICSKFAHTYDTLQPRITKTLAKAFLDPGRPYTTHYGAIVGLASLGSNVVRALLLPHVELYIKLLEPELHNRENPVKQLEARMCYGAILNACGEFIRESFRNGDNVVFKEQFDPVGSSFFNPDRSQAQALITMDSLLDLFGEALQIFSTSQHSYLDQLFL